MHTLYLFLLAVFCDYYNGPEECKWHYSPCHTPCYKTCLNPQGICSNPIPNLEGKNISPYLPLVNDQVKINFIIQGGQFVLQPAVNKNNDNHTHQGTLNKHVKETENDMVLSNLKCQTDPIWLTLFDKVGKQLTSWPASVLKI